MCSELYSSKQHLYLCKSGLAETYPSPSILLNMAEQMGQPLEGALTEGGSPSFTKKIKIHCKTLRHLCQFYSIEASPSELHPF